MQWKTAGGDVLVTAHVVRVVEAHRVYIAHHVAEIRVDVPCTNIL